MNDAMALALAEAKAVAINAMMAVAKMAKTAVKADVFWLLILAVPVFDNLCAAAGCQYFPLWLLLMVLFLPVAAAGSSCSMAGSIMEPSILFLLIAVMHSSII